jgi:hypothetical protein
VTVTNYGEDDVRGYSHCPECSRTATLFNSADREGVEVVCDDPECAYAFLMPRGPAMGPVIVDETHTRHEHDNTRAGQNGKGSALSAEEIAALFDDGKDGQ